MTANPGSSLGQTFKNASAYFEFKNQSGQTQRYSGTSGRIDRAVASGTLSMQIPIKGDETAVGIKFAARLQKNLKASIGAKTIKHTGKALRTKAKPNYVSGYLQSIIITTPYYIFPILNYGFEGSKKKGINSRIEGKDFMFDALEGGKFLDDLADEVGRSRAVQIVRRISFLKAGKNGEGLTDE